MTAEATRNLVLKFIDALNAHDLAAAAALVTEDVTYDPGKGARVIGRESLREQLAHAPRETLADVVVMTDEAGARAAVEFTRRGNGGGTRASYSMSAGYFIEMDDGLISRVSSVTVETT